ncbi:MAG TPA: tetratricopeptide repeat protein, partial [Candidatus Melainabacteria bacterium]|nr:tetratricopeptide repeat protein [Candidatus Melainabacteria bacterium]
SGCLILLLTLLLAINLSASQSALAEDSLALAADHFQKGDINAAEQAYTRAIANLTDKAYAYNRRAYCRYRLGRLDSALEDYAIAKKLDPKNADNYFGSCMCYFLKKNYPSASTEISNAIKLKPEESLYWFARAMVLMKLDIKNLAIEDFLNALKQESDPGKQADYLERSLKLLDEKDARLLRAAGYLAQENPDKAIEEADRVLKISSWSADAYRIEAEAWKLKGDQGNYETNRTLAAILGPMAPKQRATPVPESITKAEKSALSAVLKDPINKKLLATLAAARHDHAFAILTTESKVSRSAQLEEATAYALSATNLAPEDAGHWYLAGLLYQELSGTHRRASIMAEEMFEKSVENNPDYAPTWLELGLLLASQNRGIEASVALEKALALDPGGTARYAVGPLVAMYALTDEGHRGQLFFEEQYEKNPEVPALGIGQSLMLNLQGERKKALALAKDLILLEKPGSDEHKYLSNLIKEWQGTL